MHPLEQFGRVMWAGFEQLAAAGEAADALERKNEQPPAQAAEKPAAEKPAASPAERGYIDTEGHDL